jgi:hypothetical protein
MDAPSSLPYGEIVTATVADVAMPRQQPAIDTLLTQPISHQVHVAKAAIVNQEQFDRMPC